MQDEIFSVCTLIRHTESVPFDRSCCTAPNYTDFNGTNKIADCQMSREYVAIRQKRRRNFDADSKSLVSRTRSHESLDAQELLSRL